MRAEELEDEHARIKDELDSMASVEHFSATGSQELDSTLIRGVIICFARQVVDHLVVSLSPLGFGTALISLCSRRRSGVAALCTSLKIRQRLAYVGCYRVLDG